MPQLEGIRIKNYRALQDVTLGRTFENRENAPLSKFIAVIRAKWFWKICFNGCTRFYWRLPSNKC